MKPTLNSLRQNLKYTYLLVIFFLMIGCQGPEPLDLNNLENEVITFYDDANEEINFPSMNITTINNQEIVDDPKINAELSVLEDQIETKYNIGIEIRGSSSQMFPKKSYGFETKTEDYSDDLDVSIGGFSEEEDWILYGPYSDKSLIRNKIAREIANISRFDYVPQAEYSEVFINEQHVGTYLIGQKVEESKNRVNIGDDGYLVEIDTDAGGRIDPNDDVYFKSAQSGLWPEKNVFNIK